MTCPNAYHLSFAIVKMKQEFGDPDVSKIDRGFFGYDDVTFRFMGNATVRITVIKGSFQNYLGQSVLQYSLQEFLEETQLTQKIQKSREEAPHVIQSF